MTTQSESTPNSEENTLAQLLERAGAQAFIQGARGPKELAKAQADALIAAGYRPQREIAANQTSERLRQFAESQRMDFDAPSSAQMLDDAADLIDSLAEPLIVTAAKSVGVDFDEPGSQQTVEAAVAAERERCARIAEEAVVGNAFYNVSDDMAALRGQTK